MDIRDFKEKYIRPFEGLSHIFRPEVGYIVWRPATGNNTELLHIRTFEARRGHARELLRGMLERLATDPPYHSVFGFALSSRTHLREVYRRLGFNVSADLEGIYTEPAFMFSQTFNELCDRYSIVR